MRSRKTSDINFEISLSFLIIQRQLLSMQIIVFFRLFFIMIFWFDYYHYFFFVWTFLKNFAVDDERLEHGGGGAMS